jgi:hypothetical protein
MNLSTIEIDKAVAALKEKISAWRAMAKEKQLFFDRLETKRDRLRSRALRDGDSKASLELIDVRQSLAAAGLEIDDLSTEIAAATGEIEQLQREKIEAARREAWAEFLAVSETIQQECKSVDKVIAEFFGKLEPHASTLHKLNTLARRAGARIKPFDMIEFGRHFDELLRLEFAKFFPVKAHKFMEHATAFYSQPYADMLDKKIKTIVKNHDGGLVVNRDEAEQEVDQQAANQ